MKKIILLLNSALLFIFLTGCSTTYLKNRANDLTDAAYLGFGFPETGVQAELGSFGVGAYYGGMPWTQSGISKIGLGGPRSVDISPGATLLVLHVPNKVRDPRSRLGYGGDVPTYGGIGVRAGLIWGIGAKIDIIEIVDFILGFANLDILKDDDFIPTMKDGELHSFNDLPAIINRKGSKYWYHRGKLHRSNDKPAIVHYNGGKIWYKNGEMYKSEICNTGSKRWGWEKETKWYKDGKLHRENKPAEIITSESGDIIEEVWRKNGKIHREGKPAIVSQKRGTVWFINGKKHRITAPAVIDEDGTKEWWVNGKLHRLDGPAIEEPDGTKKWWVNGKRHRIGEPAYIYSNGRKEWWVNGKLHRLEGPAVIYSNGTKEWWVNGKLHRLNGPAIEEPDGTKIWYIEGMKVSKDLFDN